MPLTRRNFLIRGSLSLAAGALSSVLVEAKTKENAPADFKEWGIGAPTVRTGSWLHSSRIVFPGFPPKTCASRDRGIPGAKIDANPLLTVEGAIFVQTGENIPLQVCRALADDIGGDGQDIALTQNTTTGLALLDHGLPLREGDEILTTTHDHYVHHESIRLATGRCGATWRKIPLFDSYDWISPDEITQRIHKAIGPKTRAVGVTWVHSSSGVRLPIARDC